MGLYAKMVQVMKEVGQLKKDGDITDKSGKKMYSYLSEERTTSELQRAFISIGLVMFPVEVDDEIMYIEGIQYDKPFKNAVTKVKVKYKIVDPDSGEFDFIHSMGYGSDSSDKGSNKAMTGAFKYSQRQAFMISTGDDGDHEPSEPQAPVGEKKPVVKPPAKPPTDADILKECKEVYQQIKGDLDGFESIYDVLIKKGQKPKGILAAFKAKLPKVDVKA